MQTRPGTRTRLLSNDDVMDAELCRLIFFLNFRARNIARELKQFTSFLCMLCVRFCYKLQMKIGTLLFFFWFWGLLELRFFVMVSL